jgi:CBS domain-containing protein
MSELDTATATRELAALTVSDIMTHGVHTAKPSDRLSDVHALMRLAGIRHVPVVSEGTLVGVVSDRDIHLAWAQGADTPVKSFMTRSSEYAQPDTSARAAGERMLNRKIGCLPVLDRDRQVIGIVTESDFLAIACRALLVQQALAEQANGRL